jgi:hypothetical protein
LKHKRRSKAPIGLGFVDKGDICKRRTIDAFNREWKKSKNRNRAYERAEQILENNIDRLSIENKGAITGLMAELLYYSREFKSQHLSPESAAGFHSDFRGIIRNKPSAIDVTTTPAYKESNEFMQVKEAFGAKWNYFVGVVDLQAPSSTMYPLLLPRCDDGSLGHFILVVETDEPEEYISERQLLVRYNPNAGDDDPSLDKIQETWDFTISNPSKVCDDLFVDYGDISDTKWIREKFSKYASGLAHEFKQESGFILSAIVTCEAEYLKHSDQPEWSTRLWWVHPHAYVRRTLGRPFMDLAYNVAGVAYGQ